MKRTVFLSLLFFFYGFLSAQWDVVFDDPDFRFHGIGFINSDTGFAAGDYHPEGVHYGFILKTVDGGDSWNKVYQTQPGYAEPLTFSFVNDSLMYAGGWDGVLFKSVDGGNTWEMFSYIPYLWNIRSIKFLTPEIGFAREERTTDGGYTWEDTGLGWLHDHHFFNDSTGILSTADGLYYTANYGESWIKVDPYESKWFNTVSMGTESFGIAARSNGNLYKTIDGGLSWQWFDSLQFISDIYVQKIRMVNESIGYMLEGYPSSGLGSRILKTTNGGLTWDYILFHYRSNFEFALEGEENLWFATFSGQIFKTTNGGGDPILPEYTEIDWYTSVYGAIYHSGYLHMCIDKSSQPYLAGTFTDTLKVEEEIIAVSDYPENSCAFLMKFNTFGSVEWCKVIENSAGHTRTKSCIANLTNDLYFAFWQSGLECYQLNKYSADGDSSWCIQFDSSLILYDMNLKAKPEGNIIASGIFKETLSFSGSSIYTDNFGVFVLELNPDGELVSLTKAVELLAATGCLLSVSSNGSICMSISGAGPAFINADTLGVSRTHLICFDQDFQLMWYNNECNTNNEGIHNLTFNSESNVIVSGIDEIEGITYRFIYEYDQDGYKINQNFVEGSSFSFPNTLVQTSNNKILTGGSLYNYVIYDGDTCYGFGDRNCFIYTLSEEFELEKSSHISGIVDIGWIIEHNNQSYFIAETGTIDGDIIFANDTIHNFNYSGMILAKLKNINSSVFENQTKKQLLVHPNPSTGIFTFELPDNTPDEIQLKVFGITGQKISEFTISNNNPSFDLSQYQKGIYFIQAKAGNKIYCTKVILQ